MVMTVLLQHPVVISSWHLSVPVWFTG